MTINPRSVPRALSIDPNSRGFGFALMEGEWKLVDWGLCEAKGDKETQIVNRIGDLIEIYLPDVVVVEDERHRKCRRRARVKSLISMIAQFARQSKVRSCRVSVVAVQQAFGDTEKVTKHQIASSIARRFPELLRRLPPKRKPWQSEDVRMSIFDAVSFALTYFSRSQSAAGPKEPNSLAS